MIGDQTALERRRHVTAASPRYAPRGIRVLLHRAAVAHQRGDRYLEVQHPVPSWTERASLSALGSDGRSSRDTDLLGALADIGWQLEHVGYVSVDPERVASGATAPVPASNVVGVYLFRAVRRPSPHPRPDPF